jgi:hypothetical protein
LKEHKNDLTKILKDKFVMKQIENHPMSKSQCTYANILNYWYSKGFEPINYMFDSRGDDGDDGGYAVLFSQKNNKFYLHILWINYNGELQSLNMTEEDCKTGDSRIPDFFSSPELSELEQELKNFTDLLFKVIEETGDDLREPEDFEEYTKDKQLQNFLSYVVPICEGIDESDEILQITKNVNPFLKIQANKITACMNYIEAFREELKYKLKNNLFIFNGLDIKLILPHIDKSDKLNEDDILDAVKEVLRGESFAFRINKKIDKLEIISEPEKKKEYSARGDWHYYYIDDLIYKLAYEVNETLNCHELYNGRI